MYIVVVVESYYPSVFHFTSKEEAVECYEKNKEEFGHVVHLAKVETSHFNEDNLPVEYGKEDEQTVEYFNKNVEKLDVEWYVYR